MARISSYSIDNALNPEDKWIGTDGAQGSENGKTKNFTVQGLTGYIADYIVEEGVADISLTTNNTSGVSTYDPVTRVLNIPEYGIPWLESNATDLTIWCNGKGNLTSNTSYGDRSFMSNTIGLQNVSVGYNSLSSNTTGSQNVSVGAIALYNNTEGSSNTAIGDSSLILNITGSQNSSLGVSSLRLNTTGFNNTAVGFQAGKLISTGSGNVMLGYRAGFNAGGGTTNSIYIGPNSGPSVANTVENGKLYIANDSGTPLIKGDFVGKAVTIDGLLVASRFKVNSLNPAPATSSTIGETGEIRYDSDFIYVCVAPNTWKRSALLTW